MVSLDLASTAALERGSVCEEGGNRFCTWQQTIQSTHRHSLLSDDDVSGLQLIMVHVIVVQ